MLWQIIIGFNYSLLLFFNWFWQLCTQSVWINLLVLCEKHFASHIISDLWVWKNLIDEFTLYLDILDWENNFYFLTNNFWFEKCNSIAALCLSESTQMPLHCEWKRGKQTWLKITRFWKLKNLELFMHDIHLHRRYNTCNVNALPCSSCHEVHGLWKNTRAINTLVSLYLVDGRVKTPFIYWDVLFGNMLKHMHPTTIEQQNVLRFWQDKIINTTCLFLIILLWSATKSVQ